jgi:IclR family transcriptional regulator, KDG regulon repressor
MGMGAAKPRTIKSAERTLALLELFSKVQAPLTVGQVARELAMPQPSASMLVRNLTYLGYLEHNRAQRTFAPSIRVALLGSWIDRRFGEAQSLEHRLGVLQARVKMTAYIAIQNGPHAQYVMSQQSDGPGLNIASGQFRTLTCSAPGRALLALKTDFEIAKWVKRCNAEATEERHKVNHKDFMKVIEGVRRRGYAQTDGDQTPGMGAYAMIFRSPLGNMPLAVGAGGPMRFVTKRREVVLESLLDFRDAFSGAAKPPRAAG